MGVGPSSCSTEPDAPREDELGARWANVEQARLAVCSRIASYDHVGAAQRCRSLGLAGGRPPHRPSCWPQPGRPPAPPLACSTLAEGGAAEEREAGGGDVKQWQAQMAYRAWRVEG